VKERYYQKIVDTGKSVSSR